MLPPVATVLAAVLAGMLYGMLAVKFELPPYSVLSAIVDQLRSTDQVRTEVKSAGAIRVCPQGYPERSLRGSRATNTKTSHHLHALMSS